MPRFEIVKTVSYDLSATIDTDEVSNAKELLDLIEKEGDSWIEYEQSNGNDEQIEVYEV